MTINHNDVYDFLHGLRQQTGVDLISQPKMVKVHGRTYPTIANNLTLDKSDGWGSIDINIPHENGYVTELHNFRYKGNGFSSALVNDLAPGTHKTQSGLIRPTFHTGTSGVNRQGPYHMDDSGNLRHASTHEETHIHDFLEHISNKPSPEGHALNYYGREGNGKIPRDQMHAVDLAESLGHRREWQTGIAMPKGTEHHIGIVEINNSTQQGPDGRIGAANRHLYDVSSESLTPVPQDMLPKPEDIS